MTKTFVTYVKIQSAMKTNHLKNCLLEFDITSINI